MANRTWPRATTTMMVLATLAVLLVPTGALAHPPAESGVVERAPVLSTWILWDGDLVVLTGPPVDQATCVGLATEGFDYEGFLAPVSTVVTTPAGSELLHVAHEDRVWVYDDEDTDDPLEWLFGSCGAILAGGEAPEPLAHGEGRVTRHLRVDADGVEHGRLGVTATVTTTDGRDVQLRAHGDDGFPDTIEYGG